jgi:hypothetical protein
LTFIFVFFNCAFAVTDLLEFKLKIGENFKPQENICLLEKDLAFSVEFEDQNSFVKFAVRMVFFDNKIYVLDNNLHKAVVFDKNGKYRDVVSGIAGKGPGDLLYPNHITTFGDKIAISDNNGLNIFSKDHKFLDRIRTFLNVSTFCVFKDHVYCSVRGRYKEKAPLFLKMSMNGRVQKAFYDTNTDDVIFPMCNDGWVLPVNGEIIYLSRHWNKMCLYNPENNKVEITKIQYRLMDELEKRNLLDINRKKGNYKYFSRMLASAAEFENRLFVFLKMPRLEILEINREGKILNHFYNDTDFTRMRWYDFEIEREGSKILFYALGFSVKEDPRDSSADFKIQKVFYDEKK